MAEIGSIIDEKYEILKETGRGGMSVVYLAMDQRLNKQWAVKEIRKRGNDKQDQVIVNSLLAEADLMKRLDHPALPRIVDILEEGDTIYIVMDYIEGQSLDRILKQYGPQPEEQVMDWARQLCDALSYLHHQKPPIIYRDMKPANVMLKPEGNVKIIDFGIAREYKEQNLKDTMVLGTRGYAPPEQYSGQTDPRSDIFALGMTMHHLLTGVDPRSGKPYVPVRHYNPNLSEGIERIIDKCVQPAPENRYQSCEDLMYDLKHPDIITSGYRRKQKRKLFCFTVLAAFSVSLLVAGVICRMLGTSQNNRIYEAYVSTPSATSLRDKISSYQQAISIYPGRADAYIKMLEAFEEEGHFRKQESDIFLASYNANQDAFDPASADTANLCYQAGMMYFNYYTNADGSYDFATRVQKAYSFFAVNHEHKEYLSERNFPYQNLSECFYQICSFYRKYILQTASVDEASPEDYEKLLDGVTKVTKEVEGIPNANAYDRLAVYNGVFMLLYDQRRDMAQAGVPEDRVLVLLQEIHRRAGEMEVNKVQSRVMQSEITDNYAAYFQAVKRAYTNAQSRQNLEEDQDAIRSPRAADVKTAP